MVDCRTDDEIDLVGVLHLLDVGRALLLSFGERLVLPVVQIVGLIKAIPVELTEILVVLPEVGVVGRHLGIVVAKHGPVAR